MVLTVMSGKPDACKSSLCAYRCKDTKGLYVLPPGIHAALKPADGRLI